MAENKIVIDARINKKGAEADLKSLEASVKSTASQIKDLGKQIATAQSGRSKLQEQLEGARQKAAETAAELDQGTRQIDAAEQAHLQSIKSDYPSMNDAGVRKVLKARMQGETKLMKQQSELLASLSKQESILDETATAYQAQDGAVQALQQRHDALTAQLEQENQAVKRQKDLIQHISGDDEMQAYFNKQAAAIESSFAKIEERQRKLYGDTEETATQHAERIVAETKKALAAQDKDSSQRPASASQSTSAKNPGAGLLDKAVGGAQRRAEKLGSTLSGMLSNALRSVGSIGTKAFGAIQRAVQSVRNRLTRSTKVLARFRNRLMSLVSGALIFNLVSAGLRKMTNYMGAALLSSTSLRQALGNLQGAAATAAAPLIQVLAPALTTLANAAATVFAYLAKLVAFLTGKTVSSAKAAAKGLSGTSKAAKEAAQSLAGFDEIERLDKKDSSSGGSGASSITPNYNFDAKSPFLDSVLAAIEAGEWNQVGQLIAQKLNETLAAIPWPDIQDKAQTWAANIADTLNGFIARLDWRLVGSTLAQGLNTALIFADTLVQSIHWDTLGNGIGNGMNQCVEELDWEALGRLMIAKWKIVFETLHGFIQTFDFSALGDAFARATMAAINNIDWPQAAADLVSGAAGLIEALAHWIDGLDWQQIGSTIAECITNIDYAELAQAILDLLSAAVTGLADGLSALAGQLVGDFIQGVKQWFDDVQTQAAVAGYGDNVARYLFDGFINGLEALWNGIGQWIYDHIFTPFKNGICEAFGIHSPSTEAKSWGSYISQGLLDGLASKWENITGWLRDLKQNFVDAWDNIRAKTTETFNSLGQTISDIWNGISSTIKTAVNGIIGFINRMISAVVTGINAVINALNGLSFDLPDIFGGGHVGFHISTLTAPQIPYLAQGAVIPANREFLAVLGDQSHGTNVEAPLDTIKQAVAEVMEDLLAGQMAGFEAVVAVLREILSAVYGIELTDEDVGRAVQRWQRKQAIATGGV